MFPFLRYNSKYLYLFERISIDLKFFLRTLFSVYKNEEEAVNQDSENVVLRAFEVLRSWKIATIQLKEKTDETQYSLWISETLKLSAEVKLKDEAEINIGGMIILCTRGFKYIAELLNENSNMLLGFSTDSTNSLGSISEDGTDSALYRMAEEYEVKVVQLEKVGLLNFANMVRQISANFILGLMEIKRKKVILVWKKYGITL